MRSSLVVFLAVALLAVSCTSLIPGKGQTGGETATGTKGLALSFLANAPPKRVLDAEQFDIVVELQNLGAEPIERVLLDLSGFDPNTLRVGGTTRIVDNLDGTRVTKVPGYTVEEWSASINPESIIDTYIPALLVTGCYSYRTVAAATVCIDTGFGKSDVGSKACSPANIKISQGQGAPVAVVKVDPEVFLGSGNQYQMQFRIYFKNVGPGMLFQADRDGAENENLEACPAIDYDYQNKVKVDRIVLGSVVNPELSIPLICQPGISDQITLYDNQGLIICQTNGDLGQDTYQTTLFVELSYGYTQSIKKQITVVNTPTLQRANLN